MLTFHDVNLMKICMIETGKLNESIMNFHAKFMQINLVVKNGQKWPPEKVQTSFSQPSSPAKPQKLQNSTTIQLAVSYYSQNLPHTPPR